MDLLLKKKIRRDAILAMIVSLGWLLVGAMAGSAVTAQAPAASFFHPYGPAYQAILSKYVKQGLPGAALLVRTWEEGTWLGAAGYARLEDQTPMQPDNVFFTLSSAKSYTAAAILMLRDQTLVDLDAKMDAYLPWEITDRIANGHAVTVRHLLTHTAGIPDWYRHVIIVDPWNNPYGTTWRDLLEALYDEPALFAPGAGREYTNINYLLLALIINNRIGDHARFFSTWIFQPLGLTHTFYKLEPGLPRPPKLVDVYFDRYGDGAIENVTDPLCALNFNANIGCSGILADMADNARFMEALAGGELFSPESWAEMIKPSYPGFEWYGLGIGIIKSKDGQGIDRTFYEMAGSGMEGLSQTRTCPELGITISLATNIGTTNHPLSRDLFLKIIDEITDFTLKQRGQAADNRTGRDNLPKPGKSRIIKRIR